MAIVKLYVPFFIKKEFENFCRDHKIGYEFLYMSKGRAHYSVDCINENALHRITIYSTMYEPSSLSKDFLLYNKELHKYIRLYLIYKRCAKPLWLLILILLLV